MRHSRRAYCGRRSRATSASSASFLLMTLSIFVDRFLPVARCEAVEDVVGDFHEQLGLAGGLMSDCSTLK